MVPFDRDMVLSDCWRWFVLVYFLDVDIGLHDGMEQIWAIGESWKLVLGAAVSWQPLELGGKGL